MYKTEHGDFNGTGWENFCQICFKMKYENEGYQEMPAWQGDLGIEGFTRTGITFNAIAQMKNTHQRDSMKYREIKSPLI